MKPLKQEELPLELIEDLGMQYATPTTVQPKRYGVFLCPTCTKEFTAVVASVKNKNTKGCSECRHLHNVTHGQSSKQGYKRWEGMIARCTDTKHQAYPNYGARGIKVYEEWVKDPKSYLDYITSLPDSFKNDYSIDRIDNDKNYEPGNLRWVNACVQSSNRRANKKSKSKFKGVTWNKAANKWVVRLMVKGKRVLIGYYTDETEAAKAYDNYVLSIGATYITTNKGKI